MMVLIAGGYLLGSRIRDFKRADRYVEVKGLVERTVKSDSATWPISFSEAGDSLPAAFAASEKDKSAVLQFFGGAGLLRAGGERGERGGNGPFGAAVQQQCAWAAVCGGADHYGGERGCR